MQIEVPVLETIRSSYQDCVVMLMLLLQLLPDWTASLAPLLHSCPSLADLSRPYSPCSEQLMWALCQLTKDFEYGEKKSL